MALPGPHRTHSDGAIPLAAVPLLAATVSCRGRCEIPARHAELYLSLPRTEVRIVYRHERLRLLADTFGYLISWLR